MPFKKGDPGGPGRPKQKPFLEWCGKWTVERAEQYLAPIAEDNKNRGQLEAIKLIMAYGVGKPVETQIIDAEIAPSIGSSVEELAREASDLIGGAENARVGVDWKNTLDSGK